MNIPFAPPYIDEDVIKEVTETLNSGWITSGPKVYALERLFEDLFNVKKALCVNSWTSGAMLVMKWWGIKEGDEVIIPSFSYAATALSVLNSGGKPVMVDIGDDLNIDVKKIRDAITERTKIIMPVDIAGLPCDYDEIKDIISESKNKFEPVNDVQEKLGRILLLSDSAHSIGAEYKNTYSGNLSDISVFSLHAVKNVTTAEGGIISLNLPEQFDVEELYKHLKLLSMNGQTKDAFTKTQNGNWKYDIIYPGLKINMPDVLAAIGLAQLRKYKSGILLKRKEVFLRYIEFFKKEPWAILPEYITETKISSFHVLPLRIKNINEEQRDRMIELISSKGISVNVHFIPMPMLSLFKGLGYDIKDFPNAYKNFSCEISLPVYPQLKEKEIDYICDEVKNAYNKIAS